MMRTAILDYITGLSRGTFAMSTELPYDVSGQPLYLKNYKRIYVDADQVNQDAVTDVMNAAGFVDETTIVRAYFVTDAKQLPSNYESLVEDMRDARLTTAITGVVRRLCQVTTRYESDALITQFEYSFTKLITN